MKSVWTCLGTSRLNDWGNAALTGVVLRPHTGEGLSRAVES